MGISQKESVLGIATTDKRLLYFGPLTALLEWTAILAALAFADFSLNAPISTASAAPYPMPVIFGTTLTLAGVTYALFTLPLRTHWKNVTKLAGLAGVAFALTGWIPYRADGSTVDALHNFFAYFSTLCYGVIVWKFRTHTHEKIGKISQLVTKILIASLAFAVVSLYFLHKYFAVAELTIMMAVQFWAIIITVHSVQTPEKQA